MSTWRGDWAAGTAYLAGDVVAYGGSSYLATVDSTGNEPPGTDWKLLAAKGADGAGGGAESGSMVWTGDYDNTASYAYGDVVRTADGLFVALESVTGVTPSIPMDPFTDSFNRADNTSVGSEWNINDGWGIVANKASVKGANGLRLLKTLAPDGKVFYTTLRRGYDSGMHTRLVFGWTDASNYYYYVSNTGAIVKVVGGVATTLGTVAGTNANTQNSITIEKVGGTITVNQTDGAGFHALTVTDASPMSGSSWGLVHYTYGGSTTYTTTLDQFEFVPQSSSQWSVIERKWSLDSLTNVQAPRANDNDILTYDSATGLWQPEAPAANWKRWTGTQAAYNALGTYDPDTLYVVIG